MTNVIEGKAQYFYNVLTKDLLVRGSLMVFGVQIIGTGLKYLLQVFLARWMGPFEFGEFTYIFSWVILLGTIAGIGLPFSVLRFVPKYFIGRQWNKLFGFMRFGRIMIFVVGMLMLGIGTILTYSGIARPDLAWRGPQNPGESAWPVASLGGTGKKYGKQGQ